VRSLDQCAFAIGVAAVHAKPMQETKAIRKRSIFIRVTEDVLNFVVAVVMAGLAVAVLASGLSSFVADLKGDDLRTGIVELLDNMLLVLMLVEILHTVGISLNEHRLRPEPFLVVALIASIRRMLIITAELGGPTQDNAPVFRLAMQELMILTALVLVLVGALIAVRRWAPGQSSGAEDSVQSPGDSS
jgi:uncharacterized membrane protein (DUF373 family)